MVEAAVNGTTVAAFGVDSLNVPLVSVRKLAMVVNEELDTSRMLLAEVPMLTVILLKRVKEPVPVML